MSQGFHQYTGHNKHYTDSSLHKASHALSTNQESACQFSQASATHQSCFPLDTSYFPLLFGPTVLLLLTPVSESKVSSSNIYASPLNMKSWPYLFSLFTPFLLSVEVRQNMGLGREKEWVVEGK